MDMERVFMSCFFVQKKPTDIFSLIEAALQVGACKYPALFQKRKTRIIKFLMDPEISNDDFILDDEEEEDDCVDHQDNVGDDDDDCVDHQDNVGDEDEAIVTGEEEPEKEKQSCLGTQQSNNKITAPTNQKQTMKVRLSIKKTVQVTPMKKHNNCNAIKEGTTEGVTELKKRSDTGLVQHDKQLDGEKEGTQQSHNTTMGSRKSMSLNVSTKRVQVAPPREKQLISDSSFKKQLEGDKQLQKQTHKGNFKKMETDRVQHQKLDSDTGKKREGDQQTPTQSRNGIMGSTTKQCTSGLTKSMSPPLMKMNVATKRVEVAPPPQRKQLLSDFSPQKQSNCSSITRPMQKTTQSSAVARPMQKETQSISHTKKFESSKRKFEERLAEQREAKRRIVMVDFRDMPKPVNDPHAPRRCWDRRRF